MTDEEGWMLDEDGNQLGYCNACGEEAPASRDCCDDGEVVPPGSMHRYQWTGSGWRCPTCDVAIRNRDCPHNAGSTRNAYGATDSDYPPGSRKIDKALTDMQRHLDWLVSKRAPSGHQWFETDVAREIGVKECMDILVSYHAKVLRDD